MHVHSEWHAIQMSLYKQRLNLKKKKKVENVIKICRQTLCKQHPGQGLVDTPSRVSASACVTSSGSNVATQEKTQSIRNERV